VELRDSADGSGKEVLIREPVKAGVPGQDEGVPRFHRLLRVCGTKNKSSRVHRGLWVCKECKTVMQADLNGSGNNLKIYLFGYCRNLRGPVKLKSPDVYRWDKRYNKFVKVSPMPAA
jgi:hypothetical protein